MYIEVQSSIEGNVLSAYRMLIIVKMVDVQKFIINRDYHDFTLHLHLFVSISLEPTACCIYQRIYIELRIETWDKNKMFSRL